MRPNPSKNDATKAPSTKELHAKGKRGIHHNAGDDGPPPPPDPLMTITNDQLLHKHWWPVIGLVAENSPVESLLVDLMVNNVEGNSVITIKKDDLIKESLTLLKQHLTPCLPDDNLSRREHEKISKIKVEEELAKEKERQELERQQRLQLEEYATGHKPSKTPLPGTANKRKKEEPQTAPAQITVPPASEIVKPRTLADDLFDELQFFNKDKTLPELLKSPSVQTLALLIKYKLMVLKRFDSEIFYMLYPDLKEKQISPISKTPSLQSMLYDGKKKGKPPKDAKSHAPTKDVKGKQSVMSKVKPAGPGSIGKSILPLGTSRGKEMDPGAAEPEPPQLAEDEVIRDPLYVKLTLGVKRARARACSEIPDSITRILQKQKHSSEYEDMSKVDQLSESFVGKALTGDFGTPDSINKNTIAQSELEKMQQLFLASIMGTENLPPLNHVFNTRLGLYGLPAFPTSKKQMVRYVILQGFLDADILTEMSRQKAAVTCIFKVQFLSHRNRSPLRLSNLLWIRRPQEQCANLIKFWADVTQLVDGKSPGLTVCPLTLQVKHDVSEYSTKTDFQELADGAGKSLGHLFYHLVKATTVFQFYNNSLNLQFLPKVKGHQSKTSLHPELKDVYDVMANLAERVGHVEPVVPEPSSAERVEAPPIVNEHPGKVLNFIENLQWDLFHRGLIAVPALQNDIFPQALDSRHMVQQGPRNKQQTTGILRYLGLDANNVTLPKNGSALNKALENYEISLLYNKQWVEQLMYMIFKSTKSKKWGFPEEKDHVNPLAEAMTAWRTGNKPKRKIHQHDDSPEFVVPIVPTNLDSGPLSSSLADPKLKPLAKMRTYHAVVTYPPNRLLTELCDANQHFLHHTIMTDELSGRKFIVFHAIHDKTTHSHIRHHETRLHSKSDFQTFVCNTMEGILIQVEQNLNKMHRCLRRPNISPKYPFGCQGQFAYQNCTRLLSTPSSDHFTGFIRRYSLKNLVRHNKKLFAERCNWNLRRASKKSELTPQMKFLLPKAPGASTIPEKLTSPALLKPVEKTNSGRRSTAKDEPFIWNRARGPLAPRCTTMSIPRIPAYSLSNLLTKIVCDEERIYCCDAVVSIDSTEFYNGTTALYATAAVTDGLQMFLSQTTGGRTLSLEFDCVTRLTIETTESGLKLQLLDPRGMQIILEKTDTFFCQVKPRQRVSGRQEPCMYSYSLTGKLCKEFPDGSSEYVSPSGRFLTDRSYDQKDSTGGDLYRKRSDELSLRHFEKPNIKVQVSRSGVQKSYQKLSDGFLRCVQFDKSLRMTNCFTKRPEYTRNSILFETPDFPRICVDIVSGFYYVSTQDSVLILTADSLNYFVVAGANAAIITVNGSAFIGKLSTFCDLFGMKRLDALNGFASADFLNSAKQLTALVTATQTWQASDGMITFSLTGSMLKIRDLSGYHHEVLETGEIAHHERHPGADDHCVLPNPRIFIIDPATGSGSEYLLGEEAQVMKYKVLYYYSPKRMRILKKYDKTKRNRLFPCKVSDEPYNEWSYEGPDVLPGSLLSDLKCWTNYRIMGDPAPYQLVFGQSRKSSASEKGYWSDIVFVNDAPLRPIVSKSARYSADT